MTISIGLGGFIVLKLYLSQHLINLPMPYQEIYDSGFGFTDPEQAKELVEKTQVDWLWVAIGNMHGAVSAVAKDKDKVETRLNIGTEIRHAYERALRSNSRDPRQEVASRVRALIQDVYNLEGTAHKI